jgi:hypothetical protein
MTMALAFSLLLLAIVHGAWWVTTLPTETTRRRRWFGSALALLLGAFCLVVIALLEPRP